MPGRTGRNTMTKFDDKGYPTKLLNIPGFEKKPVNVESLEKSLSNAKDFVPDEAQIVDEKTFSYVLDDIVNRNRESLVRLSKK